jgi:hypothetical protein
MERSELQARWIELVEGRKPAQVAQVSEEGSQTGGRGKQGGISAASRRLGISRREAQRAVTIAEKLAPEAKAVAREIGLADNQASARIRIRAVAAHRAGWAIPRPFPAMRISLICAPASAVIGTAEISTGSQSNTRTTCKPNAAQLASHRSSPYNSCLIDHACQIKGGNEQ